MLTLVLVAAAAFAGFQMNGMVVKEQPTNDFFGREIPHENLSDEVEQKILPPANEKPNDKEEKEQSPAKGGDSVGGGLAGGGSGIGSSGDGGGAGAPPIIADKTPPFLSVSETANPVLYDSQQGQSPQSMIAAAAAKTGRLANYTLEGETEEGAKITINDEEVAVSNGRFYYETNLTEGANSITVAATDPSGNTKIWNTTRLIDSDMLPDWYEEEIGSDPLNSDSDNNTLADDHDDYDYDGIPNYGEFSLGSSALSNDTDGDNLTDAFELYVTGTVLGSNDSDGDGITDGMDDPDSDNLTNVQEQSFGADPFSADTDSDGLGDWNETATGTDPGNSDTDSDGLDDRMELVLGQDPKNPDSNGNGLADGNETYTQSFENDTVGASIDIAAAGGIENVEITNETQPYTFLEDLPGLSSGFVDFSSDENFSSAIIRMEYDPENVSDPSKLKLYYFDPETSLPVEEPIQGVNTTGHYLWANTTHFSGRFIADPSGWSVPDWNRAEQVYSSGETMRIKARIHNLKPKPASNVEVRFFAGDPSEGRPIGTSTISVAGNSIEWAFVDWPVNPLIGKICVRVDPSNLIPETEEGNNNACRDISRMIDTDGDGLSDYEETNGMRQKYPYAVVRTDPYDPDTDGDGLTDGEELGAPTTWNGNMVYIPVSDPTKADTDGDGLDDWEELEGWEAAAVKTGAAVIQIQEMLADGRDFSEFIQRWNVSSDPFYSDTDRDGLSDYEEYLAGTSPRNADTDTDRIPDGVDDDAAEFDTKPPVVRIFSISVDTKKSFLDDYISISGAVFDESGILSTGLESRGDFFNWYEMNSDQVNHRAVSFTLNMRTQKLTKLSGRSVIISALDMNYNSGKFEIYADKGMLVMGAKALTDALNSDKILDIQSKGFISGFAYSMANEGQGLLQLAANPAIISEGIHGVFSVIASGEYAVLTEAVVEPIAYYRNLSNPYSADKNPVQRLQYDMSWSSGYVAGFIASAVVGGKGLDKAVEAIKIGRAASAASKLAGTLEKWAARPAKYLKNALLYPEDIAPAYRLSQFDKIDGLSALSKAKAGAGRVYARIRYARSVNDLSGLSAVEQDNLISFVMGLKRSEIGVWNFINHLDDLNMKKFASLSNDIAENTYMTKLAREMRDTEFTEFLGRIERLKNVDGLNVKFGDRIGPLQRTRTGNIGNMDGAMFEIKSADIIGVDKIKQMSAKIPGGEVDIVLKDGTFVECKSWVLSVQKDVEMIERLKGQINNMRDYNPDVKIIISFDKAKGALPELISLLKNEMKVIVEVI